jgi:hypothetical protein
MLLKSTIPNCIAMELNDQETETRLQRQYPLCPKCKEEFAYRIHRSFLFKLFLFWLPVRRYYCNYCRQKMYIRQNFH